MVKGLRLYIVIDEDHIFHDIYTDIKEAREDKEEQYGNYILKYKVVGNKLEFTGIEE